MLNINCNIKINLASGMTDLRKAVDGLAILIQEEYQLNPFSSQLFVFCNRERNKLKILHWEHNGFWLYYRRLQKGKFKWPEGQDEMSELTEEEFRHLLEGMHLIKHQTNARCKLQFLIPLASYQPKMQSTHQEGLKPQYLLKLLSKNL